MLVIAMAASAESMVNNVMPLLPVSITDPSDKDCPLKSMQLNDCKAGMQGLDKDYINHIIYQTSKGINNLFILLSIMLGSLFFIFLFFLSFFHNFYGFFVICL